MIANPQGRGFFVIKVNKVTPGNALIQPTDRADAEGTAGMPSRRIMPASSWPRCERELKVKRNDSAIQAFKTQLLASGG